VLEGFRAARRERGIRGGILVCGLRHMSPETNLRLAELSVAYKNRGVFGYDLAGAEDNFPAKDHIEAFQLILDNNVSCTAHAGEAYGPASIAQAIHYCGAHRIGHGVRLREDGDLLNYCNDHRIPLECCPSSNVQTRAVTSLKAHPLKFYLDLGMRVTVNTDNRLITDTTVTKELVSIQKTFDLPLTDIRALVINGFKSAFIPFHEKAELLRHVNREIDAVIARYQKPAAPAADVVKKTA
jgi:adenosine deaminase